MGRKRGNNELTERDSEILEYIKWYMLEYNTTPTINEICVGVGNTAISGISRHLERLEDHGELIRDGSRRYQVKGIRYREVEE